MNRPLIWSHLADDEFDRYKADYESKSPGLGDQFADAVIQAVDDVEQHPFHFATINWRKIRLAPAGKFPFGILYRVHRHFVIVTGVVPLRSNPGNWMFRG